MTSDQGEMFNALRAARQEKRAENRETSVAVLKERGIPFDTRNGGTHLIVGFGDVMFDFWPGTGKFKQRPTGIEGRGVFTMLRYYSFLREKR